MNVGHPSIKKAFICSHAELVDVTIHLFLAGQTVFMSLEPTIVKSFEKDTAIAMTCLTLLWSTLHEKGTLKVDLVLHLCKPRNKVSLKQPAKISGFVAKK